MSLAETCERVGEEGRPSFEIEDRRARGGGLLEVLTREGDRSIREVENLCRKNIANNSGRCVVLESAGIREAHRDCNSPS